MTDNSWRGLEFWERVRWARSQRFESAAAAADAVGMKDGTYRCYERGPGTAKFIRLDYKHARHFARTFRVRWEWLLDGTGEPWLTPPPPKPEPVDASPPRRPNNLRAWREFRGLTLGELAKKSGLGVQTIQQLEDGSADLSVKPLDKLAPALDTTAGFIIDYDPHEVDTSFFDAGKQIPKDRRAQALEILKTFRPYQKLR